MLRVKRAVHLCAPVQLTPNMFHEQVCPTLLQLGCDTLTWITTIPTTTTELTNESIQRLIVSSFTVCGSITLKSPRASDYDHLQNCTIIEGNVGVFLGIGNFGSMNDNISMDLSFPNIVEITDYLLVFKANRLESLSQLFPNLFVIRGHELLGVRVARRSWITFTISKPFFDDNIRKTKILNHCFLYRTTLCLFWRTKTYMMLDWPH